MNGHIFAEHTLLTFSSSSIISRVSHTAKLWVHVAHLILFFVKCIVQQFKTRNSICVYSIYAVIKSAKRHRLIVLHSDKRYAFRDTFLQVVSPDIPMNIPHGHFPFLCRIVPHPKHQQFERMLNAWCMFAIIVTYSILTNKKQTATVVIQKSA